MSWRSGAVAIVAGAGACTCLAAGCRRAPSLGADCLTVAAPQAPVGFDVPFSIAVTPACSAMPAGRVAWRQLSGPALRTLAPDSDGFRLTARMPPAADVLGGAIPWGVVPISPRTRGDVTLEARWSDGRGRGLVRGVRVAAAARSRGLPNTPVGARVYLGGEGWRLVSRPPGSVAVLGTAGGLASLLPDRAGEWQLADGHGRALSLRSGRYDETPLDCGRAGCHAAITDAAAQSPMTTVLARGLATAPGGQGAAFGADYPGCALACHATGEPGIPDGGFPHVAAELGAELGGDVPVNRSWPDLPRPLRRLGGVGCLACHGPGALPEASARWSILRADVCAVCHDAPPRYGHVAAWRRGAMSRADRDPRARSDGACVRCHTTWGFLGAEPGRRPPDDVGPVGITCAACHAVHATPASAPHPDPHPDPLPASGDRGMGSGSPTALRTLLRAADVCQGCHAPDPDAGVPSATATAIWLGRGGIDPESGLPFTGPAPHASVASGCVGCHRADAASPTARGAGHGFAALAGSCRPCHDQPPSRSDVSARARSLWQAWRALSRLPPADPATARVHAGDLRVDRGTPLGRAAWDVLLVLEDPAAAAHNGPYARALLAAAEPVIRTAAGAATGGTP